MSDTDPVSLERHISREVRSANAWYEINGMIANPSKHQGMILGKTDHRFNFFSSWLNESFWRYN